MCDKAVDNYPHALQFVPDCYKAQKMCDKAVNTHLSTIQFILECYETQEMCDKALNRYFLIFNSIPDWYKTYEMCEIDASEDPFMILYCLDRYETQRMCDEAIDYCLAALKFIPDWFLTSKMLKKFHNVLLANDKILFFNEDFNKVTFIAHQRYILAVDLDKINLDGDNNFDKDDPDTIIHVRNLAWRGKFEIHKVFKKNM